MAISVGGIVHVACDIQVLASRSGEIFTVNQSGARKLLTHTPTHTQMANGNVKSINGGCFASLSCLLNANTDTEIIRLLYRSTVCCLLCSLPCDCFCCDMYSDMERTRNRHGTGNTSSTDLLPPSLPPSPPVPPLPTQTQTCTNK